LTPSAPGSSHDVAFESIETAGKTRPYEQFYTQLESAIELAVAVDFGNVTRGLIAYVNVTGRAAWVPR
jgi:hypothetical protein